MRFLARLATAAVFVLPSLSTAQAPQFDGRYPVTSYRFLCRDEFTMGIQCDPAVHASLLIGVAQPGTFVDGGNLGGDWIADLMLWEFRPLEHGSITFNLPPSAGSPFLMWPLTDAGLVGYSTNGLFRHYILGLSTAPDPIVQDGPPTPDVLTVQYTSPFVDFPYYTYVPVAGQVVPEPASLALLGSGLGVLVIGARRRRRRSA